MAIKVAGQELNNRVIFTVVGAVILIFLLTLVMGGRHVKTNVAGRIPVSEVGCISTTFHFLSANDKVCITAYADPDLSGVTCFLSQARTGGVPGMVGLATDPSRFGLACRQTGPLIVSDDLSNDADVFSESTSLMFKSTRVRRMVDKVNKVLVYVAYSTSGVDGSPSNSLSVVPYGNVEK